MATGQTTGRRQCSVPPCRDTSVRAHDGVGLYFGQCVDTRRVGERAALTARLGLRRAKKETSRSSANFHPEGAARVPGLRALAAPSAPRRMGRRWKALQVAVPLLPIPLGCWFLYKAIVSFNRSPPPYAISDPKKVMEMPLHSEPVYQARRAHSSTPHQDASSQPLPPPSRRRSTSAPPRFGKT